MPSTNLEITKAAIDDFKEIQEYMLLAKEENAEKTYAKLKKKISFIESNFECRGCKPYRYR